MSDNADTNADRDRKWKTALMVLSLEHAGPFWSQMGVAWSETPKLRAIALRAFEQLQALMESPAMAEVQYEQEWQRVVAVALKEVVENAGSDAARAVQEWVEFAFPWQDNQEAQAIVWTSVWRKLQESELSTLELPNEIKQAFWRIVADFVRWKAEFGRRFDALIRTHGAGSDLEVMVSYPEDCSPYDWVSAAVIYHHFEAAWLMLEALLSDQQLDELTRWMKAVAEQHRVKSSLIERPRFVGPKHSSRDSS